MSREYTLIDRLLGEVQDALITVFAKPIETARENPSNNTQEASLNAIERSQSAGFMRVNHTGEVCAQALYRGQAWYARDEQVRAFLKTAVAEEQDHLIWCHQRLNELSSYRSYLNLYWYTHSFLLGWVAGRIGDDWSLGFVEETEIQVGRHLQGHMKKLSNNDKKSFAIIEQMDVDEAEHAETAKKLGAKALPDWIKGLMSLHSKIMTTLTYKI